YQIGPEAIEPLEDFRIQLIGAGGLGMDGLDKVTRFEEVILQIGPIIVAVKHLARRRIALVKNSVPVDIAKEIDVARNGGIINRPVSIPINRSPLIDELR